jgi:hypothetical protein
MLPNKKRARQAECNYSSKAFFACGVNWILRPPSRFFNDWHLHEAPLLDILADKAPLQVYIIFELKEEPLEIVVALKERRRAPLCLYANSANALFFSSFSRLKRAAQNKSVLCKRSGGIKSLFAFPHTARPLIRPDWHMSKRSLCSIH